MSYQTYITDALVCGSRDNNTSDRSFLLFTREAGMVWASARSVREERSKQRYALQDFSHIKATLVRGKGGWRVAGVESFGNVYYDAEDREARTLIRNIVRLLRRFMQGETPHPESYDDVIESLLKCNVCDPRSLELALTLRILSVLGYVASEPMYEGFLHASRAHEVALFTEVEKKATAEAISHALLHSQL